MCLATGLTAWCLYKYSLDEDVSLVSFANFNDDENKVYPALTTCFWNPFLNKRLNTYGPGINTTTYSSFIQGNYWDTRMVNIDYDDVTVSLEDFLIEMGVQYGNFSTRTLKNNFRKVRENEDMPRFYVSDRNGGSKCFTFIMPYIQKMPIVSFFFRVKASIFPGGKRASYPNFDGSNIHGGGFTAFFHLPGEHFRSYFDKKHSWNNRANNTKNYDMLFTVKNIEVLKHRNKFVKPCNSDWKNDDDIVMYKIMQRIGCTPPHWKSHTHLKPCLKTQEIKQFRWPTYEDLQKFPPPCQIIEKLQYEYEELDDESQKRENDSTWFGITLFFPEPSYKEIKQAQAYDIESFVGNSGGYIGLFLGYSLASIPSWITSMFRKISKRKGLRMDKMENGRERDGKIEEKSLSSAMDEAIDAMIKLRNKGRCNHEPQMVEPNIKSKFMPLQSEIDPGSCSIASQRICNCRFASSEVLI